MEKLYHIDSIEPDDDWQEDFQETSAVLKVEKFSFAYEGSSQPLLAQVDMTLYPGQITLLLGKSGSGKTTLFRHLKPILAPRGRKTGVILFQGRHIEKLSSLEAAAEIGFLFQNPDAQLVMETVYEELVFGLENIGLPPEEIQARISDTVSFCGVEHLLTKKTAALSGGQKQLVNLCAILCFRPKLLLLDEPFAQLDPESVRRVVEILQRLRRETSVTILISEQRLEDWWSLADQVIYLHRGNTCFTGSPREFLNHTALRQAGAPLPALGKIFARCGQDLYHLPLTLWEGQSLVAAWRQKSQKEQTAPMAGETLDHNVLPVPEKKAVLLEGKEISFAYPQEKKIILKQISLQLRQGERLVLCGSNGAGKTTLLKTMAGILRPLSGHWRLAAQERGVCYLSQQCQYHFRYDTPQQEFAAIDKNFPENRQFLAILEQLGIDDFLQEDLYTLSLGQQQRVSLAMTLLVPAAVYLLDEPTKGLDGENKEGLKKILQEKTDSAIVIATHDLEFAAAVGTDFTTLCYGQLTQVQRGADFFAGRYWQTTAGAKLFGRRALEWGWYNSDNIPENWGNLLQNRN